MAAERMPASKAAVKLVRALANAGGSSTVPSAATRSPTSTTRS